KRLAIEQKLGVGFVEICVLPLVFPSEESSFPNVRPAVLTVDLRRALLEAVIDAERVRGGGRWMVKYRTEIDEMFVRGRAFLQLNLAPLGNELSDRHWISIVFGRGALVPQVCRSPDAGRLTGRALMS